MTDFGSAWSCLTDLTMPATYASSFRVVAEAIARRWQTPRGGLIDDPNYGFDLSDFVNDDIDPRVQSQIAFNASQEAKKDERVLSCDVTVTPFPGGVLIVTGSVTTEDGPFTLVVSVSDVTITLLQVTP